MHDPLIPRVPDDWTVWAFSDPHGVATGLEAALVRAGLLDEDLRWVAPPRTALVGRGDYLDRGLDSPRVVALLRRLELEAAAAGSRALFSRGNHEHLLYQLGIGARTFHEGRSLGIDTNACGNPQLPPGARLMVTLVELAGEVALDATRRVVVATDDAPDRRRG